MEAGTRTENSGPAPLPAPALVRVLEYNYSSSMLDVLQTRLFVTWLEALADERARGKIRARIGRLERGLFGDAKSIGDGVSEMRVDYGPGYRLYYTRRERTVVILLCGGDKGSQARDIKLARVLVRKL